MSFRQKRHLPLLFHQKRPSFHCLLSEEAPSLVFPLEGACLLEPSPHPLHIMAVRCLCCALHYQAHTLYLSPPPTAPSPAVLSPLLQLSSVRGTHSDDLTPRSPLCCLVDPLLLLPSWGKVVTGIHTSLVCSCYA